MGTVQYQKNNLNTPCNDVTHKDKVKAVKSNWSGKFCTFSFFSAFFVNKNDFDIFCFYFKDLCY